MATAQRSDVQPRMRGTNKWRASTSCYRLDPPIETTEGSTSFIIIGEWDSPGFTSPVMVHRSNYAGEDLPGQVHGAPPAAFRPDTTHKQVLKRLGYELRT